jgi:hypothetical protein
MAAIAFVVAMRVLVRHLRNVRQNGNLVKVKLSHVRKVKVAKNEGALKRGKAEVKAKE